MFNWMDDSDTQIHFTFPQTCHRCEWKGTRGVETFQMCAGEMCSRAIRTCSRSYPEENDFQMSNHSSAGPRASDLVNHYWLFEMRLYRRRLQNKASWRKSARFYRGRIIKPKLCLQVVAAKQERGVITHFISNVWRFTSISLRRSA